MRKGKNELLDGSPLAEVMDLHALLPKVVKKLETADFRVSFFNSKLLIRTNLRLGGDAKGGK
jgi:hypothetical protein